MAGKVLEYVMEPDLVNGTMRVCKPEEVCVTVCNALGLHRVLGRGKVNVDISLEVTLSTSEMQSHG
jgi:hypothetical protein